MTGLLTSPYPVPRLAVYKYSTLIGWAYGVVAGTWVLVSPPASYDGLGLALTTAWGAMLAVGSGLVILGNIIRKYKIELPGLVLALGGVVIYGYLSWSATLGDSPGSGPRASLLVLLASLIVARVSVLLHIDREARRMASLREG